MVCFSFLTDTAEAASVHEMSYFQYHVVQEDGRQILRIEVGFNKNQLEYAVHTNPYKPKQLLIDLQNTEPGDIQPNITLDGKLGRYMTIRELERRHVQLMVSFGTPVEAQNYKVYTLEADRKAHKPFRLVIDVMEPRAASAAASDRVEGLTGKVIVLDPGHGGSDSGAIGPSGLQEKDVTLPVSQDLRTVLENSGARVVMTRQDDRDVYGTNATDRQELQARVNVGTYTPGMQVFLSIHCNAFSSQSANGTETFYYPHSYSDALLAQDLQDAMIAVNGLKDRGISEANFYVVKHSDVPSALVELAFISNYNEEGLLGSEEFQKKVALAIARGLGKFFQDAGL